MGHVTEWQAAVFDVKGDQKKTGRPQTCAARFH
jgi:hypothetical protein